MNWCMCWWFLKGNLYFRSEIKWNEKHIVSEFLKLRGHGHFTCNFDSASDVTTHYTFENVCELQIKFKVKWSSGQVTFWWKQVQRNNLELEQESLGQLLLECGILWVMAIRCASLDFLPLYLQFLKTIGEFRVFRLSNWKGTPCMFIFTR